MKLFVWLHKAFTVLEQNIETNEAHICRSLIIKFTNNSFLSGLAALSNISNI